MTSEPAATHQPTDLTVLLLDYPLGLGQEASAHYAEVLREMALLVSTGAAAPGSVPYRVTTLVTELAAFREAGSRFDTERAQALERGEAACDLSVVVTEEVRDKSLALDALLDEVDEYCRAEEVLTLPPPTRVVGYRRWYVRQISDQVAGAEPTPWPRTPA